MQQILCQRGDGPGPLLGRGPWEAIFCKRPLNLHILGGH